jgi:hypothetical protein
MQDLTNLNIKLLFPLSLTLLINSNRFLLLSATW